MSLPKAKVLLLFLCGSTFVVSCSKDNETNVTSPTKPNVNIEDAQVIRKNSSETIQFDVVLSASFDQQVSVDYTTIPGSAKSDKDYKSKTGTLTFQPSETKLHISVPILVDSLRQPLQKFYVQLNNPKNVEITKKKATGTIINNGSYLPTDDSGYESPENYQKFKLIWSDEFNEKKLNPFIWNYKTGTGSNGWGNNELEYYTSRSQNVFLSSGNLIIEARKEDYKDSKYTSARITTQGKKEFTYGRFDIRAKLPVDQGMWPALWMLGANKSSVPWPKCGEIDIMELIGKKPSRVQGAFHWQKAGGSLGSFDDSYSLSLGDFSQKFHVFSLLWSEDSLKVLIDGMPYTKASRSNLSSGTYPFDNPFFLIFNVAVGGNWPGPPNKTTKFPQRMYIDYVRVFQKK